MFISGFCSSSVASVGILTTSLLLKVMLFVIYYYYYYYYYYYEIIFTIFVVAIAGIGTISENNIQEA
jgi:hypothetical protein